MSEIVDNIYIWVFLIKIESVLLLALVQFMLCSHFTQNCILSYFFEAKNPFFCDKKLLKIFLYFCIYFVQKTALLTSQKPP